MERVQIDKVGDVYTAATVLKFGYGGSLMQVLRYILEREGLKNDITLFTVKGWKHGSGPAEIVDLCDYSNDARSFRISNPKLEVYLGEEETPWGTKRPKLWGMVTFF